MRKKYFNSILHQIQKVFGLNRILNVLKFSQHALFLNHMNDLTDIPKISKNIIYGFRSMIRHN